jgi:hypothetical protein
MSDTTIRTAVYNAVNGVTDVGQVYDYQRWASDYSKLLNLFKTTISNNRVIRGWTVTSEGFTSEAVTLKLNQRVYRVKVRGFFGLDDGNASEKTAANMTETVISAIDAALNSSSADPRIADAGTEWTTFEPRLFGDVLCHYIELTVNVATFKERGT